MMISAFARESRLSVDTVRLYVRRELFQPKIGKKGGSRPYQIFSTLDVEKARVIRLGKAFGLSLSDIGAFLAKRTFDGKEEEIVFAFLSEQRCRLTERISDLEKLVVFIDAKEAWMRAPTFGPPPVFP